MVKNKKIKNIVIFGSGAIGSHLAYCLKHKSNKIYLITKKKYLNILKKKGLKIEVRNNKKILIHKTLKNNRDFQVFFSIKQLKNIHIDYLFITLKLRDYNLKIKNKIKKYITNKTTIIPPCTNLPDWWFNSLRKKKLTKLKPVFPNCQIIGMTMWLSATILKPGHILVRHIQRGYPLKAVSAKFKIQEKYLRKLISRRCKSPKVKCIYSEIFKKSINSLSFNLVALKYKLTNFNLAKKDYAINEIKKIMTEGEQISKFFGLKLDQTISQRIKQTLSSKVHTMSMLSDYKKNKKSEMPFLIKNYFMIARLIDIKMDLTKKIYKNIF